MNSNQKIKIFNPTGVSYSFRMLDDTEFMDYPRAMCFSYITYDYHKQYIPKIGVEVIIKINRTNGSRNTYCVLTEDEMKVWLAEIAQWIDYDYTLTTTDDEFVVQFTTHVHKGTLKILLTLIRFSHETPYNVCLKEAFVITEKGYFMNNLILHKYQAIQNSCNLQCNSNHCFGVNLIIPLLSIEELKKNVTDYQGNVNNFFKQSNLKEQIENVKKLVKTPIVDYENILDISDIAVQERVIKFYEPNFKATYSL